MKQFASMRSMFGLLCLASLAAPAAEAALLRRHDASGIANATSLEIHQPSQDEAALLRQSVFDQPAEDQGAVDAETQELEDSIVQMLKSKSNHSGKPKGGKTGLEDGVKMMKKMVKDQMMPKVLAAHKSAQLSLDALYAAFTACNSKMTSEMLSVPALLKSQKAASAKHKKCRKGQDKATKAAGRCGGLLKALSGGKKAACDGLKALQRDPNKEADTCKDKSNSESYGQWVKRIRDWIGKKSDEYDKADHRCGAATKKADDQAKKCKPLDNQAREDKVSCDAAQDQLETATCGIASKAKGACSEYVQCYNAAKTALALQKPGYAKLEANRKAEWRALKRMDCLLGIFADGDAKEKDVDKCKGKTHKTDHLNLKYGTVPMPQKCSSPVSDPCSSSYVAEEYASLPMKARAKDCKICAGLSNTLPLPSGFNVRCKHDPEWSYVLDYSDDRSKDDIPNNFGVLQKGFSNKNAFYVGNAALEKLDIEQVEMCALSSTSKTTGGQCQYSCKTLGDGNYANPRCPTCSGLSSKVKKLIAALSGQGRSGDILMNVDPGIASFQKPYDKAMWMCGHNKKPGVYKRLHVWGHGWHSQGWGISMRIDHGAGNYEVGWYNNHCGWRSKMDVDTFQIRVKLKAKSIASKIVRSRDVSKRCAPGYRNKAGDVPGWGSIGGKGGGKGVKNCQQCANWCSAQTSCKSYECSPSKGKCNLNTQWMPTKKNSFQDYNFCMRGPVFSMPQEESFDGSQCKFQSEGSRADLPLGSWPYTIEAWVKPNKKSSNGGIVSWGEYGTKKKTAKRANALLMVSPTQLNNFWWYSSAIAKGISPKLDDGKYHHVAATWDKHTRRIYVDGKKVSQEASIGLAVRNKDNFCVGKSYNNKGYFVGKMKGVKVWKWALNTNELTKGFAERVACEAKQHRTFASCRLGRQGICHGRARLGYGNRWTEWKNVKGKFSCTNGFFGKDPAPGQAKECICEAPV